VLDCPIAESQMRQIIGAPVLSIVIPTYQRSDELALAVSSIADQLTGDLEQKVEIIITDNASEPGTVGKIKHMAAQYPTVSYLLHKRNEGGFFQFFAAPWRARGRYTWVFGSDDVLMPGAVAAIVEMLEREAPSFATLNKKVFNRDLTQELWSGANTVPDRRFERFEDLMAALNVNQLTFISCNIELTEAARALDPEPFLSADTRHPHVGGFLKKHYGKPAFYVSAPVVVHRLHNASLAEDILGNAFDYAVTLPILLDGVLKDVGGPADFFERMTGETRVQSYDTLGLTFVDNIFENLLHSVAGGRYFTVSQRWALEHILAACAPVRLQQLADIWSMQEQITVLEQQVQGANAMLAAGREACARASRGFTRQT
jgi:glycosyltransferase involved in cell wall biosynthesis